MRIPTSPPKILPIKDFEQRPLWSVMIPVYNCAKYIPDVLYSVLAQDPGMGKMQIEVVDDASTDADIENLVWSIGQGRIAYYRQPKNVGSLRNFETSINRSRGKLIHLLHGDDRVKPGFYKKMELVLEKFPEAGAAFSNYSFINEEGIVSRVFSMEEKEECILDNWLIRIAEFQKIQFVSMVVRREVYENLGGFYGMSYGEDWEMWVRIAKDYPVAHSPEILAEYRKHKGSISWPKKEDGQTTKDLALAIKLIEDHLPLDHKNIMETAKKNCALYCLTKANVIWGETQNRKKAETQVKLALSLNKSPKLFYHILKFYIKVGFNVS